MKPRYIKIFIGLLLFYIGFLVINLQIVGQAAVPAVNKTMIGMQPKDTSEEKPEDLKYTITEKPLTGTTLEISGGQTINSPILDQGKKPTWPWYDKQGNTIKQLQDIKTIEVKKPLTIIGDMSEIFARMPKLENIVLDKGASVDTTGVTSFYRVFYQDSAIKSIDLSKIQGLSLDSAKNLSRVFEGDKSLESVTLSKNVDQVKDFSGLFSGCSSLTTINGIDSWKGSSATDVSNMFKDDSSLKTLDLAKFNPSPATDFSYMFAGCTALTSVGDLSQWTGSNATNVSNMFKDDSSLKKLDLAKFNPSPATNFSYMFYHCTALTSVGDLSKWTGSNATDVSNMFNGDSSLKTLDLSNFNPINVQNFSSMFNGCSGLTTITGMNSWDVSSAIFMDNMFRGDEKLTSLDLSHFNPNKVQYFSYMFYGCLGLTTITGINSWDVSSAIYMDHMFEGDKNLKSLTLNNANSENLQSVEGALNGCSQLARLDISKLNLTKANRTDFLNGCNNLWYLTLGKNSVLTNSSLPNAPDSDNPKGYPANITSYLCNTGNWQVFSPQKGENVEEALQNPNNLQDKKTSNTKALIDSIPMLNDITTYIWEPVPRGVVLTSVTSNIDFQNHFLTPTSVDLSNSVKLTVEDSRYCKKNAWKLGARIVLPKTAFSTDEHLTKTADDPILFTNTNEKGKYIRGSQASLQLNKTQLTNTENIFYTQTIQDSTSTLLQINNNLQSFYDDTDSDCTVPSNKVDQTTVTSILEFSTKNAFTIFPGSYNTTIEYTVSNSV